MTPNMKLPLFTALIAATATLTGLFSQVETASAADFSWDSSWTQPTVYNKSQTGFNDAPFQQFVQAESVVLPNSGQLKLDPSKLNLKYDHNVSVYFINEGAGYRNQLAFDATGTTNKSGLLFKPQELLISLDCFLMIFLVQELGVLVVGVVMP